MTRNMLESTKESTTSNAVISSSGSSKPDAEAILSILDHLSHLLPSQGPIKVFVHHNTLHAFEDFPFEQGVVHGLHAFGCEPYFSKSGIMRK